MGLFYRLGQFWRVWRARPLPETAREKITAVLTPAEIALFDQFSLSDQQHSYQVLRTLQANGQTHPDLLAAALLHDVGKTRAPLSIWQRSLIVLAQAFLPGKMAVWGQGMWLVGNGRSSPRPNIRPGVRRWPKLPAAAR